MICAILVIDDYPAMQRSIRRTLAETFGRDAVICTVGNARDAISILGAIKFDLIVSDYNLGDSCGAQVLEYLRAEQPDQVERFVFFAGSIEARSAHDKIIDKDDAMAFSEKLLLLMRGVPIPRNGGDGDASGRSQ
jgi:CheY-like chemotaxis protein